VRQGDSSCRTPAFCKPCTLSYTYDRTDGLPAGFSAVKSTDPKGNVTKKVYDKVGRLKEVIANAQETVYTYNDNGSVAEVEYDSGVKEQYTYYPDGLLHTLTNRRADNSIINAYSYNYDNVHNVSIEPSPWHLLKFLICAVFNFMDTPPHILQLLYHSINIL
jgi:YD repeat-containing protein